jgi:hypothetical protein
MGGLRLFFEIGLIDEHQLVIVQLVALGPKISGCLLVFRGFWTTAEVKCHGVSFGAMHTKQNQQLWCTVLIERLLGPFVAQTKFLSPNFVDSALGQRFSRLGLHVLFDVVVVHDLSLLIGLENESLDMSARSWAVRADFLWLCRLSFKSSLDANQRAMWAPLALPP